VRLRRDYLCIGSTERQRSADSSVSTKTQPVVDPDEVAAVQPQSVECCRLSYDKVAQPVMIENNGGDGGGRLSDVEQVGLSLPRRHSVPSHWALMLQSLTEEELEIASPALCPKAASNCAEAQEIFDAMTTVHGARALNLERRNVIDATTPPLGGASFENSSSTDNDQDDYYDDFVRGLQLTTTVTRIAAVICSPSQRPCSNRGSDDMTVRNVCRRVVDIQGTAATPCFVDGRRTSQQFERRRTSRQFERRSFGGKLMRKLRKTLSLTKSPETAGNSLSECGQPRASSLSTATHVDERDVSTQPTGAPYSDWCHQLTVNYTVNLFRAQNFRSQVPEVVVLIIA